MISRPPAFLHTLILSSYFIFFGSMIASARPYYSGKSIRLRDAMISALLSPTDNPQGYRIASAGTALCGVLMLPVAFTFNRALARRHRPLAFIGSFLFGLGPLSAASMIFVAPEINDLHVYLATGAYIFMTAGLLICLALAAHPVVLTGGGRGPAQALALLFLLAVLAFLVYLLFTPDFFNDKSLIRNVAFCEWTLCCILAIYISGLAIMLSPPTR
jgi:hypothetical protein